MALFYTICRCKILDSHLQKVAENHLETKFIKLDVEKAPFLTKRLNVHVIPTMGLVRDGKTSGLIVGFAEFGNCDDFSTEMLEWRLGCGEMLKYAGDINTPPINKSSGSKKSFITTSEKKSVRGRRNDNSDSDSDFE